ncbi:MAG: hypothetical protein Q7S06_01150 [Nanoarchaeota archaeon]|nr:hypothetical protein [Nanoarchaeota archaeon]
MEDNARKESKIEIKLKDGTIVSIQPSSKLQEFYQGNPGEIATLLEVHLYNGLNHIYSGEELRQHIARIYLRANRIIDLLIDEAMKRRQSKGN